MFGGDWKQLLPISEESNDVNRSYMASVKTTNWFTDNLVQRHRLIVNQRLGAGQDYYRKQLKCWGTGVTAAKKHNVGAEDEREFEQIDKKLFMRNEDDLINFVFGDALNDPLNNMDRLKGSAILCPLNIDTLELNKKLLVN